VAMALSLKGRAIKYLAAREHSRQGLRRKLLAIEGASVDDVDALLDDLQSKGFLDEGRFVETVVHRRATGFGTARVRQELQRQGIDASTVVDTLARLRDSELERARSLWLKRFGGLAQNDQERARQMRFLIGRGFGADVVQKIVRGRSGEEE